MKNYTKTELKETQKSISSMLFKCKKSLAKLEQRTPQHTLMIRRIKALQISLELINLELAKS